MQVTNARMQDPLSALELESILALVRTGTLAEAGQRMGVDASTVFRTMQRLERNLGRPLFDRSRSGYRPNELALQLARHAERVEAELEAARSTVQADQGAVTGTVRITTTDTVLQGLVLPALKGLTRAHPLLQLELTATNELASLTRRDADIAVRATRRPPEHLVGKEVGRMRVALFVPKGVPVKSVEEAIATQCPWIAPDDALPEHPTVHWRKRHHPRLVPRYKVNSILSVLEAVACGLGVGLAPLFLATGRRDVVQAGPPIAECESALWVLTHPESRHLRRIATVYGHLASGLRLA